ncbi:MAG TPA: asparagine synthase (glutamine-hydrolyzing), partial [Candidatus Norongarragalinales archaeon]|nr:asparagine synthase (glutamine-hydrolyzing) [Candidatus Norongarragalinales archaeon]
MCGITGALGFSDPGLLNRMKSSLKHRGPDQEGTFFDENVMLGHRRLSILDLSEKGRQPMSNAEGTIHVVFNGEIYNFKDLRIQLEKKGYRFSTESDTEVLVHGYDAWGPSLCERLDGDFAFALWDSEKKQLVLSRDPVGVVPLYYTLFDGALFFASEIKAFFENPNVPRRVSAQGLSDYLCFRYPVGPLTLFERIFKVQPGQTLLARMEKGDVVLEKKRYFNLTFKEEPFTSSEAVQTLRQLVAQSVEKRLQSDVPLGVYLSGGLDSSYITALASRSGPVNTFSVRFGDDDDGSDLVHELVSRFNTNHTDLSVESDQFRLLGKIAWHLDEPPADIAALPTYLMAQVTKKHATVVLTGDGGDEVFGGYPRYRMLYRLKKGRSLIRGASSLILPLISSSLRERLSSAMHSK